MITKKPSSECIILIVVRNCTLRDTLYFLLHNGSNDDLGYLQVSAVRRNYHDLISMGTSTTKNRAKQFYSHFYLGLYFPSCFLSLQVVYLGINYPKINK